MSLLQRYVLKDIGSPNNLLKARFYEKVIAFPDQTTFREFSCAIGEGKPRPAPAISGDGGIGLDSSERL
jgi:hypothetical protein